MKLQEDRWDKMTLITMVQAVNAALRQEMRSNENVIAIGEDIGREGGVFRATEGLLNEFGPQRVIDSPLGEDGIKRYRHWYVSVWADSSCRDTVYGLCLSRIQPDCKRACKITL